MNELHKAAIMYEYLCEAFDRRQSGFFNKRDEYIPHHPGPSSRFSIETARRVSAKYRIGWTDIKSYINSRHPMSFEYLIKEYNEILINEDKGKDLRLNESEGD